MSETITAGAPLGNKNAAKLREYAGSDGAAAFSASYKARSLDDKKSAERLHTIASIAHNDAHEATGIDWHKKKSERHEAEASRLRSEISSEAAKASAPAASDVVRAAGTSEGAKKGWYSRKNELGSRASISSELAEAATRVADKEGGYEHHTRAAIAHEEAGRLHYSVEQMAKSDNSKEEEENWKNSRYSHENEAMRHWKLSGALKTKASDTTPDLDVIHCRSHASAAGSVLAADKAWNPGEPVDFMWMPAGVHTICAGFRNGSIELTVKCDENTAANVQASLDAWRAERPKQEPFGCIEHREHEASVRVSAQQAFSFKDDGVYIAAEPTVLGAQNVNGKVHRSWSPSFTTDADYSQAKTVKTASGATVMVFPEGVRGSRSNPAEITGVDFCVGTLTNKPAFHAMSPVKGSEVEAVQASGTSEGAKKGWEARGQSLHENARRLTHEALDASMVANSDSSHEIARTAHREAAQAHLEAAHHYEQDLDHPQSSGRISFHRNYYAEELGHARSHKDQIKASIHAHCRATLLQDVPDATEAEVACYEKCLEDGGDHNTAVLNIKAKREQNGVAATEEVTVDTIAAKQQAALDRVNALAAERGVARVTVEDVYAKVTATGTSEGAKKGWQSRTTAAHKMTAGVDHLESALGNTTDQEELKQLAIAHDKAREAHNSAAFHVENAEDISNTQAEIVKHRHEQLSANHGFAAKRIREYRERLSASAKASNAKGGDTVTATWSDAARKAAAEAKKNGWDSMTGRQRQSHIEDHPEAPMAHSYVDKGYDELPDHIRKIVDNAPKSGYKKSAKASDQDLTLESIYARAGASR